MQWSNKQHDQAGCQEVEESPFGQSRIPQEDNMVHFAQLIQAREPEVDDVIGFMDGLALTSECTSEVIEQNAIYNGYHSDTMVNNIIA